MNKYVSIGGAIILALLALNTPGFGGVVCAILATGLFVAGAIMSHATASVQPVAAAPAPPSQTSDYVPDSFC